MDYALFRCCTTSKFLKQYDASTDAVLRKLGILFTDIKEFNCCGYPLKNIDFKAYLLSSARNLALAQSKEVSIATFCNCCFNTLKQAQHHMKADDALNSEINDTLAKEGLRIDKDVQVKHLFEILYNEIGLEAIKERIVNPFSGLKIGTQYGCHILRPSDIVEFDHPETPTIFDSLVNVTGAKSIDWTSKLDCCGSPMWGVDDDLAMDLTEKKIGEADAAGADYLCSACVFCQLQFDRIQKIMLKRRNPETQLPSILYTQLLGIGLGIDIVDLGIELNEMDATGITAFIS